MMWGRLPGLERIDQFYYTTKNVDDETIGRFYGYTLENPGWGALKQLDSYLATGHMLSADGRFDYAANLNRVTAPTLMIAGEGDVMADIPSSLLTFEGLSSTDKTLLRFGKRDGHVDDYGHCDLVWSRHAPRRDLPPADRLARPPPAQRHSRLRLVRPAPAEPPALTTCATKMPRPGSPGAASDGLRQPRLTAWRSSGRGPGSCRRRRGR